MAFTVESGKTNVSDPFASAGGGATLAEQQAQTTLLTSIDGKILGPTSTVPTKTRTAGSITSVTLLASNSSRKAASFYNDSTSILRINEGAAASTTAFTVKVLPDSYYELPKPVYTGAINGIWESATGACNATERT